MGLSAEGLAFSIGRSNFTTSAGSVDASGAASSGPSPGLWLRFGAGLGCGSKTVNSENHDFVPYPDRFHCDPPIVSIVVPFFGKPVLWLGSYNRDVG